jgi:spermidine/putrescine transport system substrate-binding protein
MMRDDELRAPLDRRRFLGVAGSAAAGALLAGCGLSTGEEERAPAEAARSTPTIVPDAAVPRDLESRLVLFNYADYVNPETYDAFRGQYPGVRIVRASYASEEEATAKLSAGGTDQYDVIVVAGSTARQLQDQGLLQPIRHEWLPNLRNVTPVLLQAPYDPGARFSVPKNYGVTGIAYDRERVSDPPRSWAQFFDRLEEFAPRTLMLEGATSVIGAGLQALGYRFGDSDPAHIREALELLKARKRFIGQISTARFFSDWGSGSVVLSQAWNGDVLRVRENRPAADFVVPEGPHDAWAGTWAIPRDAPHPRAAHAWIDFLLRPANAAREMAWSFYPVSVPAALERVPRAIRSVPWMSLSEQELRQVSLAVLSPEALREWNRAYSEFQAA